MGFEFKCWSLGTFSLQSLYFFEPSQEPKKVFSVTCLKVLLLLSFLCMKFKKRLKPGEKNEDFYHVFKAFEVLSTFSNVCQINIAAKNGIPSCRVSSSEIQKNTLYWENSNKTYQNWTLKIKISHHLRVYHYSILNDT